MGWRNRVLEAIDEAIRVLQIARTKASQAGAEPGPILVELANVMHHVADAIGELSNE